MLVVRTTPQEPPGPLVEWNALGVGEACYTFSPDCGRWVPSLKLERTGGIPSHYGGTRSRGPGVRLRANSPYGPLFGQFSPADEILSGARKVVRARATFELRPCTGLLYGAEPSRFADPGSRADSRDPEVYYFATPQAPSHPRGLIVRSFWSGWTPCATGDFLVLEPGAAPRLVTLGTNDTRGWAFYKAPPDAITVTVEPHP